MIKQFFLTACLVMMTASFLLLWESKPESFLRPDSGKIEKPPSADSYMRNIKTFIFSSGGTKKYSLKATEISLFSGLSEVKLSQPIFVFHGTGQQKNQLTVEANQGIFSKNSQKFQFKGDVNANWENLRGESVLKAARLSYSIKDENASADGGIQLTTPDAEITGESISANFESKILKIENRVKAIHDAI